MRLRGFIAVIILGLTPFTSSSVGAAETCGNGVDDDSDGLADEGCFPAGVTGVHDSPFSDSVTGYVAPVTGQLIFPERPDLAPRVPYGPSIAFQRTYFSQYEPGYNSPNATNFKAPMGFGWQHSFMSWVELDTTPNPDVAVLHTTSGHDVLFSHDSTGGGEKHFVPQAGYHLQGLAHKDTGGTPYWKLTTLSGWIYEYDWDSGTSTGKLVKITDAIGNVVTLTYNGDGQVSTVRDASGNLGYELTYQSSGGKLLYEVGYYSYSGGSGTLLKTIRFFYTGYKNTGVRLIDSSELVLGSYTYDGNDKVTAFADATSVVKASVYYISGSDGQVARVETPTGWLGYEYDNENGNCSSGEMTVYFGAAGNDACDTYPADCESAVACGGETDSSSSDTGRCFNAYRCVATSSPNEDLIGQITASCASCTSVLEYFWDTNSPTNDKINLAGVQHPNSVGTNERWTSYLYDSNGLVTKMVENDDNSDASDLPTEPHRVTFYTYDSTFPGLVSEVRRLSELKPSGTCTSSTTTDCKRTIYSYTTGGLVDTVQEVGFTLSAAGSVVGYDFKTDYDYDSVGRLTIIKGPRSSTDDDVEFTYWTSGGPLQDGQLKEIKRKKATSTYITTTLDGYDDWGNATSRQEADGTFTCSTFHEYLNVRIAVREAMNGQTSCVSTHASDLVTTWTRDDASRILKVEYPKGNCTFYDYDSGGRLTAAKDRDDCTEASSGDSKNYSNGIDGLRTKIEYKNASNTVTYRKEFEYGEDRRLVKVKNPVDASAFDQLSYTDDGLLAAITALDVSTQLGKTDWSYDDLGHIELMKRYLGTSTSDEFDYTPGVQQNLPTEVEDEDAKGIEWVWDDLGRKVKQITPDHGTSIYLYDEAGNLTFVALASTVERTFTYDTLNRLVEEDDDAEDCGAGQTDGEIVYVYDDYSGSCPSGPPSVACENQAGRLAMVKTKMFCDDAESDDTFDQEVYYSYDDAGRLVEEAYLDDGGRDVRQTYAYDTNGNLTQIVSPANTETNYAYDNASNSDANRVKSIARGATEILAVGSYLPFGPVSSYTQKNSISGYQMWLSSTWNLAYRPTAFYWNVFFTTVYQIVFGEDAKGRINKRDFTYQHSGIVDSYFTYDQQDRVLCNSGTSGSCPTEGVNLKNNLTGGYTASNDRVSHIHNHGSYDPNKRTYTWNYVEGTDKIDYLDRTGSTGNYTVDYGYDARGNRTYDDDSEYSYDRRDFTYDGRGRMVTQTGKYKPSSTWDDYTLVYAYDHKNRRVWKSFVNENTGLESQWFFYYDLRGRLVETRHIPNIASPSTYSLHQFYWLEGRPIMSQQTNYPSTSTWRRYMHGNELHVPLDSWLWPASGDSTRAQAFQDDASGWQNRHIGGYYQPFMFPGMHMDEESTAWGEDGSGNEERVRPQLYDNGARTYDPLTGGYLQVDPMVGDTWQSYAYASHNPIGRTDPGGMKDEVYEFEDTTCPAGKVYDDRLEVCVMPGLFHGGDGWLIDDPAEGCRDFFGLVNPDCWKKRRPKYLTRTGVHPDVPVPPKPPEHPPPPTPWRPIASDNPQCTSTDNWGNVSSCSDYRRCVDQCFDMKDLVTSACNDLPGPLRTTCITDAWWYFRDCRAYCVAVYR